MDNLRQAYLQEADLLENLVCCWPNDRAFTEAKLAIERTIGEFRVIANLYKPKE